MTVIESANSSRKLPPQMTQQLEKYKLGLRHYYREVLNFYQSKVQESRRNGNNGYVKLTEELHSLIIKAMAIVGRQHDAPGDITLLHKKKPLDVWRVEFVIEYEIIPSRGFKLSCSNGGGLK